MIELWILLAVIATLSQASMLLVSEYFNIYPLYYVFWKRLLCTLALLPLVLILDWPADPLFYLFVFIPALIFAYFDMYYIGMAAKSGAGVISRIEPLSVMLTFVLWTIVSPVTLETYIEQPGRTAGIVAAFAGSIYFSMRMRKCEISADALRAMLVPLILAPAGIIMGKMAMERSDYHSGVICYAFLQSLVVWIVYAVLLKMPSLTSRIKDFKRAGNLMDRRVLLAGLCAAAVWLLHTPAKYYAITDVENPAYVTVITLTAPLWILGIYRLVGRREKADIASGLGVVFCAVLLVIFTQF